MHSGPAEDISTANETAKCYFLELPPELRSTIYELSTTSATTPIEVATRQYEGLGTNSHQIIHTFHISIAPLLQLSRQIREEATPMFYGLNTFRFSFPF